MTEQLAAMDVAGGSPVSHAGDLPQPSSSSGDGGREKVYVAVGREAAGSKAMVLWALARCTSSPAKTPPLCWFMSTPNLDSFPLVRLTSYYVLLSISAAIFPFCVNWPKSNSNRSLFLSYQIKSGLQLCRYYLDFKLCGVLLITASMPFTVGARIPASQVQEQELMTHKRMELQRATEALDQHLLLCAQEKVQAEKLVVESDNVAEGLVKLISEHRATALVMGAAADKHYTKKMKALKSKKAQLVEQQSDPSCKIWYICKGTLVCRRKAVPLSHEAMPAGTLESGDQQFSMDRSASLSETWCVSNTWLHKPNLGPRIERTSPCRSYNNEKEIVKELDEPENKFQHMQQELESVRKQAYEEKCSHEKAEEELFEAFQKAQATENMYFGEVKQKNEIEEKLTATTEEVERLAETNDELCTKLQEERKKRLALEKRTAHSDRIIKDLMLQRDKAVREVEALHAKKGESSATAEGTMQITELSCTEINEATNNFELSSKVGESVYGSVYKGFLRHTNVAIKKLNLESTQSQSQFNQEIEILSRVRHPNLVTLIGACNDAQALVYEYMSNGSLDDRLACKDNSKPLSWQLRTRIISNVCSALMFLHSTP